MPSLTLTPLALGSLTVVRGGTVNMTDLGTTRGAICFTWDDSYASHDVVRNEATARGQHHTFAVQSNTIGTVGRLTAAQVALMFAEGHEIASHSVSHAHMIDLTVPQRVAEYDNSKTAIEAIIGTGNCKTWIYPYGDTTARNATTDLELYLRYERISGTAGGRFIYDINDREATLIWRKLWNDANPQAILNLIRWAAVRPVIVAIYSHDLNTTGSTGGPTTAELRTALDLCEELNVPCLTLAEAFPSTQALLDPGFEDSALTSWAKLESPAGRTYESVADTPASGLTGSRSLHLATAADTEFIYAYQTLPCLPGRGYTLSCRYRVGGAMTGAGSVKLRVREKDYTGVTNLVTNTSAALTSTSWAQATLAFTTGASTALVEIGLGIESKTADVWFDHVHWGQTREGVLG